MLTLLPTPTAAEPAASEVVTALLHAIVEHDVPALRRLLAPDVWFRALVVRELVEHHEVAPVLDAFDGWFGQAAEVQVCLAETASAGSRELLRYRLRLRPAWAPDVWHVIEQTGYARVADGRVRRLDLLCTGFVPEA
jgi:hypothetical protein